MTATGHIKTINASRHRNLSNLLNLLKTSITAVLWIGNAPRTRIGRMGIGLSKTISAMHLRNLLCKTNNSQQCKTSHSRHKGRLITTASPYGLKLAPILWTAKLSNKMR